MYTNYLYLNTLTRILPILRSTTMTMDLVLWTLLLHEITFIAHENKNFTNLTIHRNIYGPRIMDTIIARNNLQ